MSQLPARQSPSLSYFTHKENFHWGAWSLQLTLKQLGSPVKVDGYFGQQTADSVVRYQANRKLVPDGVAGYKTQSRIVLGWANKAESIYKVPNGLLDGVLLGEGGGYLAPVNWAVPGGVDFSAVQQRIYLVNSISRDVWNNNLVRDSRGNVIGPNEHLHAIAVFDVAQIKKAANTKERVGILGADLRYLKDKYYNESRYRGSYHNNKNSWRYAILDHNWPWASEQLALGNKLSTTKEATWVPPTLRAKGINTYSEWAEYYMNTMTRFVRAYSE